MKIAFTINDKEWYSECNISTLDDVKCAIIEFIRTELDVSSVMNRREKHQWLMGVCGGHENIHYPLSNAILLNASQVDIPMLNKIRRQWNEDFGSDLAWDYEVVY